jgi:hypothetical protein
VMMTSFPEGSKFYFILLLEFVVDQMPFFSPSLCQFVAFMSQGNVLSAEKLGLEKDFSNSGSVAVRFGVRRSRVMDSEDVVSQQSNANRW